MMTYMEMQTPFMKNYNKLVDKKSIFHTNLFFQFVNNCIWYPWRVDQIEAQLSFGAHYTVKREAQIIKKILFFIVCVTEVVSHHFDYSLFINCFCHYQYSVMPVYTIYILSKDVYCITILAINFHKQILVLNAFLKYLFLFHFSTIQL